jgi:hypothetical protein
VVMERGPAAQPECGLEHWRNFIGAIFPNKTSVGCRPSVGSSPSVSVPRPCWRLPAVADPTSRRLPRAATPCPRRPRRRPPPVGSTRSRARTRPLSSLPRPAARPRSSIALRSAGTRVTTVSSSSSRTACPAIESSTSSRR